MEELFREGAGTFPLAIIYDPTTVYAINCRVFAFNAQANAPISYCSCSQLRTSKIHHQPNPPEKRLLSLKILTWVYCEGWRKAPLSHKSLLPYRVIPQCGK